MMAMARLNLPAVYLYGGTIIPGTLSRTGTSPIQDVFEAVGAHAKGTIDDAELLGIERARLSHAPDRARGMYTANTMAAVGEAIGLSLPGAGVLTPAVDYRREVFARESGIRAARARRRRRSAAEGHPDEGGVRERGLRDGDGARRLDERRAAPAARSLARRGSTSSSTTSTGSSRATPHLVDVRPAGKFVMSGLRPGGRRAGGDEGVARRGAAATGTA